jgi:VCBS repeat-containing protein
LTQVATALEGRSGVDAIHIVSHGQEARLLIGTTSLDQGSISGYSETLATIGQALDADGDILLYGCDIGSGDNGLDFITSLGQSTAADIAASVDLTGNPELGGDWSLELSAGEVDSRSAITGDAVAGYTGLLAADNAPVLTVGTITTYAAGSAAHVVAPDLTVAGDNSLITNARVTVTNYAAGDVLGVTGMHGVTGSQANGVLTLTGSATAAQWQEVLRTVTFQSSGANEAPDRAIRFDLGTQRKHHYEYVGAAGITWNSAMTAAANRQYNGMQGYLATITSAGENAAVAALVPGDAWIGATDNYSDINTAVGGTVFANQGAAEGRWYWAAGPEKGQQFWQGGANGGVVNGGYAGWPSGIEPNNKGGNENYALTSVSGHWNDLDNINRNGYVVEYGGLGNDPALVSQTITQVVNDAPVAVNDSGSATEAGTAAGSNATGNLLSNDTHDPSTALTVTAVRLGAGQAVGTAGTIGQGLVGSYGSLTLNADGGYTYAPDNDNAAVQALAAGETLLERFTYTVADGGGLTDTAVLTVTINGANDAPTATASVMPSLPGTAAFIEGTAVIIAPDAVLSDVDSDNLSAVTVTLNAVPDGTAEILSVTGLPTGISTAGYDAATRTLTLTGAASVADYQAALRLVKYNNTSDVPTTSDRSISITATDRAHAVSAATTVTVTVTAVNDAPVAVNDTGSATEAGGAANGTGGANAIGNVLSNDTDVDGTTRTVIAIATGGKETGGIAGTLGQGLAGNYGSLTLNADGSYTYAPDNDNAAVQALTVGETLLERFKYTVADGGGRTDVAVLTVTITGTNDSPVLNAATSPTLTAATLNAGAPTNGSTAGSTRVSALVNTGGTLPNVTDPDAGALTGIAVTGVSDNGTLWYSTNAGTTWTKLTGTVSDGSALLLNADSNTRIYFRPNATFSGAITDAVTFKAWDRTAGANGSTAWNTSIGTSFSTVSDTASVVVAVNDAPVDENGAGSAGSNDKDMDDTTETQIAARGDADTLESANDDPAQGANDKRQVAEVPLSGKPSLSAQIKAAGRDGLMAESLALLESLLQAAGVDDIGQAA